MTQISGEIVFDQLTIKLNFFCGYAKIPLNPLFSNLRLYCVHLRLRRFDGEGVVRGLMAEGMARTHVCVGREH
jgi:hypothetical protein